MVGIILFGFQSVQADEVDWETFSKNLVKALQSDNDGLMLSAALMIVQYGEQLDVKDAVFDVMRIFRNDPNPKVRQLALVTLTHMKSDWAMEFLKREIQFEKDPVIKKQLIAVTSESYQKKAGKVNTADVFDDFNQLKEEVVELSREEALYTYKNDADGNPLDASKNKYVLKFPKGQLPPVESFWSMAVYNSVTQELSQNPLNQYPIGSPMIPGLIKEGDGSLVLYIQKDEPGKKNINWLPTPDAPFYILLRLYWPKKEALNGTWKAPAIQMAK
jgi:hypothetical protein